MATLVLRRNVWNNEEYPYLYRTFESFRQTYPRTYIVAPRIGYDDANQGYCEWRLNSRYLNRNVSLHLTATTYARKLDSLLRSLCSDVNLYCALSQKRRWHSFRNVNCYRTNLLKSASNFTTSTAASTITSTQWHQHMYKHQKWSYARMAHIEDAGLPIQVGFPTSCQVFFSPLLMNFTTTKLPPIRGGILADDMGLGKTMVLIALSCRRPNDRTLVVCPPAILDQWRAEVEKWTTDITVRCQTYYGQSRELLSPDAACPTIIITTYGVLRREMDKQLALANAVFDRVIFDESHIIKSEKSKQFKACMRVRAPCRWCVSGTPAPSPRRPDKDIVKQFHLAAPEYVRYVQTCQMFEFVDIASTIFGVCGIRHHRSQLEDLELNYAVKNTHLTLDDTSRHRYETLIRECSETVARISNLELCRWTNRLLCRMVCGFHRETNFGFHYCSEYDDVDVSEVDEICSICLGAFSDPVITACCHIYCARCLDHQLRYNFSCPLCRSLVQRPQCMLLHDALPRTNVKAHWLVEFLRSHSEERVLIMSQFRSTLNWIVQLLERRQIICCHLLNATRSRIRRNTDSFKQGECKVLLLNARTSTGMDLHCADHVIFMELLPRYVESQAIARASRVGTHRTVQIHRLLIEDSVESFLLTTRSQRGFHSSMQSLRQYLTPRR